MTEMAAPESIRNCVSEPSSNPSIRTTELPLLDELEGLSTVTAASLHPSLELAAARLTGSVIESGHTHDI